MFVANGRNNSEFNVCNETENIDFQSVNTHVNCWRWLHCPLISNRGRVKKYLFDNVNTLFATEQTRVVFLSFFSLKEVDKGDSKGNCSKQEMREMWKYYTRVQKISL